MLPLIFLKLMVNYQPMDLNPWESLLLNALMRVVDYSNEVDLYENNMVTTTRYTGLHEPNMPAPNLVDLQKVMSRILTETGLELIGPPQQNYEQSGNGWFLEEYNEYDLVGEDKHTHLTIYSSYDTFGHQFEMKVESHVTPST